MVKNIAASIRHRLLNQSRKTDDETFNNLAERYLRERFLYRLSQSKKADDYILKGATVKNSKNNQIRNQKIHRNQTKREIFLEIS